MTHDNTPNDERIDGTESDAGARDGTESGPDPASTRRGLLRAAAGATVAGAASTAGCLGVSTPADVAAQNEVTGNVAHFVGPSWLADNRDDVVVLDARDAERFRTERIYGARRVPFDAITSRESTDAGLIPDAEAIAAAFGEVGVSPDDDVLVYGASVGSRVTRVAFALAAVGHAGSIRVLNGGLSGWNGRLGTGSRDRVSPAEYEPDPAESTRVTREWLADRVGTFNDDGPGLVDVRVAEAYVGAAGADALDPDNDRHGHLPGAIGVHWVGNVSGRRLTEPSRLVQLYEAEAELDRESTVVVYGGENVDPTSTWLTLRAIGFSDVRLYDGGFAEWANVDGDRGRYPVETATNVVIETDGSVGEDGGGGDFSCTG
ncbi:rhodanese-like domain-containing protein [Halorubrum sp. AD140]|uniref:sulfurtransferase n=1 Tax=Halorubrum sp. AD140 TaxID=3050073 RepID=UPI002ACC4254|nr:rhodanese-like domain-containing protein [Halorubrum sp. AD140]MDZ5810022.1 rhodanese-like domain-containing protein [Halorubrum sp. AD140]